MNSAIRSGEERTELVAHQVGRYERREYLGLVGNITLASVMEDVEKRSFEVETILRELGYDVRGMDHSIYEGMAKYAIDGDCSILLSWENSAEDLFHLCSRVVGMNELFNCFEEYASGPGSSPHLILAINMFEPRARIDSARLGGDEANDVSLIEISLLAGMKEASVRNYAVEGSPHYLKTKKRDDGNVFVDPAVAHAWLSNRRKYVPTQLPEDPDMRNRLLKLLQTI